MFGTAEPAADAQVIAMAMSIFNRLGLADDIEVSINSIGCPTCRAEYRKALRTYFEGYKNPALRDLQFLASSATPCVFWTAKAPFAVRLPRVRRRTRIISATTAVRTLKRCRRC